MADGLLGAYFGNPNIQRQGARARELAKRRDVNLLPDPKTYAVVQGLLGTPPDQMGFSVLNPKYQEIKQVAEPAFYAGSLLQVAPATAPAVNRIAQAVGPRLEKTLLPAFEAAYNRGGLTREMVEAMGTGSQSNVYRPSTPLKPYPTVVRDASEIFGQGAKRIKYTDPNSGGVIDVLQRPDGTASVLGLEVPEAMRGQGIGQSLQSQVMQDFPEMMGQVSSKAAAKTAYRLGRRPPNSPDVTLDDVYKMMDEYSSVNLVSPEMQKRFMRSLLD